MEQLRKVEYLCSQSDCVCVMFGVSKVAIRVIGVSKIVIRVT
jgi:hypothetical protein